MVKLYALCILYKGPSNAVWLKSAFELQSFGFFQRSSVQEFITFFSKTIVERTPNASRQSIKEGEYMCHAYVRADGLSGVVVADQEYPQRVAHTLLSRALDEFQGRYAPSTWPTLIEAQVTFPQATQLLSKYQNPRDADAITKIQEDLDETKIILHNTIDAVLQRGEKLDDLVSKSEVLSLQAKTFYTTAKKTNSCCTFS